VNLKIWRVRIMSYSGFRFELDRKNKILIAWPLVFFWEAA